MIPSCEVRAMLLIRIYVRFVDLKSRSIHLVNMFLLIKSFGLITIVPYLNLLSDALDDYVQSDMKKSTEFDITTGQNLHVAMRGCYSSVFKLFRFTNIIYFICAN